MPPRNFEAQIKAAQRTAGGCLIWPGAVDRDGYGRYSGRGAYRVAYETFVGTIPAGQTVDHVCFNRRCVNVTHLRLLSLLENARNHRDVRRVIPDSECVNGHLYDAANTYAKPGGGRDCRACIRDRVARYKARKRSAAA